MMTFSLYHLALLVLGYLAVLLLASYAVDKKWVPSSWLTHPLTYVLSLGVYASSWAFYGSVGMASEYGYGFLAYYFGISGAFAMSPILLRPILRITRRYQLSSLADLLAFRYRSRWAGTLVTLVMLAVVIPMLSLQITAIGDTLHLMNREWPVTKMALAYCFAMMLFAILFGARHASPQDKQHKGLVFAIAIESVIKLGAMLILGGFVLFYLFPEAGGLKEWLGQNQDMLINHQETLQDGPWRTLLLMFFSAAVAMPHMFHMVFTENRNPTALRQASWGFPLFLIAMSICIPPILWAATYLNLDMDPSYYALGIGLQSESTFLTLTTFFGGLAAASGIMIVTTLAMSAMLMNHVILPYYKPTPKFDFYRWLLWGRRLLILVIILFAYGFYQSFGATLELKYIGILAFVAASQFMPGVLGLLYWPQSHRIGFIAGLIVGTLIWVDSLLLPFYEIALDTQLPFFIPPIDESNWHLAAIISTSANFIIFVAISLSLKQSDSEIAASDACSVDSVSRPSRQPLVAKNSQEIIQALSPSLGKQAAEEEVSRALNELELPSYEDRPYALRRLRARLEANLSGLVGPTASYDILNRYLPYREDIELGEDIHQIEQGLEGVQQLSGLASELDNLRRYHRQTLQDLPIGVCSLTNDGEILMWNHSLEGLTGISSEEATGSNIDRLIEPWQSLISDFFNSEKVHLNKHKVDTYHLPRWFSLNKAMVGHNNAQYDGTVILIEEQTETQRLEDELIHSERLASIGRLAAGVAHEIGNPVTGIDCLAQNIRYETTNPELLEMADQIQEQTKRVTRIVQSLMNFSHAGNSTTKLEAVKIKTCVEDAIHLLTLGKRSDGIKFTNHCPDSIYAFGDGQRLVQVFVNLLGNAQDASEKGGEISVLASTKDEQIQIKVIDQGHGVPKEVLDSIFEPFFTTKEVGKGTGLGLSLVYSIIEQHYGNISIESPYKDEHHTEGGTCVNINLPLYDSHKTESH